ncbi:MAG: hypothetical protein HYZ27_01465 [Deltaproteobacteria bacterium]|nr:hypothetical protein [Deltaproteobacteria bacterium]
MRAKEREYQRARCLARLATLEWAKAVALAKEIPAQVAEGREPAPLGQLVRALVEFPDKGALEQRLADLGFTAVPGAKVADAQLGDGLSVEDALTELGRVTNFDVETGRFPNEHDELMGSLSRIAAPTLDGVVFEEVPPSEAQMDNGPYLLRAYMDGKRYELRAENNGDWYDLGAVLGLLNALLTARKSELRFIALPTGDQTATVLAGPRKGIQELAQQRLIGIALPDDGMKDGKAFEAKVFEQLRREGRIVGPAGAGVPVDFVSE